MISIHSLDLKNPPLYCQIKENSSDSYEDVLTNVLPCSEQLVSELGHYPPANRLDVFFFNSGNGNFSIATLNNSNVNNSIKNLMELLVINHKNEMIYLLECKNMFGFITQQLIDTINFN